MALNVSNVIEWQSHKEAAVLGIHKQLLEGNFFDAILFSSDQKFIKAHRIILAAFSPILEAMFKVNSF